MDQFVTVEIYLAKDKSPLLPFMKFNRQKMEITMQTFAIQDVGDWLIEIKLYEKGSADFSIY